MKEKSTERVAVLDGVRGLAVLIVLLSHTSGRGQALHPALSFQGIGHIGVYLFFVLSGYLLTNNLLTEFSIYGNISLRRYFARRFFRIAPLYYLVISYVFIKQIYTEELVEKYLHVSNGWAGYFKHLLFYQGDSVFWTIPTEVFFYLLLPLIFSLYIKHQKLCLTTLTVLAVTFSAWTLMVTFFSKNIISPKIIEIKHLSQFIEVFIMGCLSAFIKDNKILEKYLNNQRVKQFVSISLIGLLLATLVLVSKKFLIFDRPYFELRWFSMLYATVFSLVIIFSQQQGFLHKIFNSRFLKVTGILGFSIYLLHFEIIQFVNTSEFNQPIKFIISIFTIYSIAYLTYKFIECPFVTFSKTLFLKRGRV